MHSGLLSNDSIKKIPLSFRTQSQVALFWRWYLNTEVTQLPDQVGLGLKWTWKGSVNGTWDCLSDVYSIHYVTVSCLDIDHINSFSDLCMAMAFLYCLHPFILCNIFSWHQCREAGELQEQTLGHTTHLNLEVF